MQTADLCQATSNLWAWLRTWQDEKGGIHGYVVHHHRDNLRVLSPDTWTQGPCALGLLAIYNRTNDRRWLQESSRVGDYLVGSYIWPLHAFANSNHEHKPLGRPELISNMIASYALLELVKAERDSGGEWQRYHDVAKDNLLFTLSNYWDSSVGALLNPGHELPQHIHNMNSVALMALIALGELEEDERYVGNYAKRMANYTLSCQVTRGALQGAYPYRDAAKAHITLYSLITCLGLLKLYGKTGDPALLASVEQALSHVARFVDQGTHLVCHYHKTGYPQWVPDTLLLALVSGKACTSGLKAVFDDKRLLAGVLSRQYPTGGLPLSIGFEDIWCRSCLPSKPGIRRWRDVLPTPNWNAWDFWALCELLPGGVSMKDPAVEFPFSVQTDAEEHEGPYRIEEHISEVLFMSGNNELSGVFGKKSEVAQLCTVKERNECWRIQYSLNKYPRILRDVLLEAPRLW